MGRARREPVAPPVDSSVTGASAPAPQFPVVGDGTFIEPDARIHPEELQLASRNKAMPLEALRYDVTPTGMHYSLIHYDIPAIDPAVWRLSIRSGERTFELSLPDLRARPWKIVRVTMECAGDGRALAAPRSISQPWLYGAVGTADWTGIPLGPLLAEVGAGDMDDAAEVVFSGHDEGFEGGVRQRYQRGLPLPVAHGPDVVVAWAMNGAPLEPQHGFPVRLVVPGWYGMAHVKWLSTVEVIAGPFTGYQQKTAYRYGQSREETGRPVDMMRVRSLMIPPGVPDFLTRVRVVPAGSVEVFGRAWSGNGAITKVEFSDDGGAAWQAATLGPPPGPHQWQSWFRVWTAEPGEHVLSCRAFDATGAVQPTDQFWTARGMGNNAVHRVPVIVTES